MCALYKLVKLFLNALDLSSFVLRSLCISLFYILIWFKEITIVKDIKRKNAGSSIKSSYFSFESILIILLPYSIVECFN